MSQDDSSRKPKPRGAPVTPDPDADSLDFTTGPDEASGSAAAPPARAPRKTAAGVRADRAKAESPRGIGTPLLIILAIAGIAFFVTHRSLNDPAAPVPSAKPRAPTPQAAPAYKPPQASTPAPAPEASAPLPPVFLKAFEEYATRPGIKAMALALDKDGRSAYGGVSGAPTQSAANDDALAECARVRAQSGIQEECRMYAVGNDVVW